MFCQLRWKGGLVRHYEIDQSGCVRCSLDHTVDIPTRIQGGKKKYRQVQLMVGGGRIRWLYVHRLMGFSWLRIKHVSQTIVDHIDGNGLNNNLQNLRWVTPRVNNLNRKDICVASWDREPQIHWSVTIFFSVFVPFACTLWKLRSKSSEKRF